MNNALHIVGRQIIIKVIGVIPHMFAIAADQLYVHPLQRRGVVLYSTEQTLHNWQLVPQFCRPPVQRKRADMHYATHYDYREVGTTPDHAKSL